MSNATEKARVAHDRIHSLLMNDWDPIGVRDVPEAQDEYDAYVSEIYRLLSRRCTATELFEYLWWAETEHMGLRGDRQRTGSVADRLVELLDGVMPGT